MRHAKETAAEARSGRLCLNVGGTIRYVERALVGIAPPGSLAHAHLAGPAGTADAHFVDERPQHFGRLLDCLRHGDTALDFMHPYDAAIVCSLLTPRIVAPDPGDREATDTTADGAIIQETATNRSAEAVVTEDSATCGVDPIVRLLVDGDVLMDVARSTLASPPDSLLARMARGDPGWSLSRAGDRLCIDQNRRHFGLLLDCLRHGLGALQYVDDLYDLWGVRALGIYYAIDAVRDAAQLAIGWRGYLDADESERCTTYIVEPGTSASMTGLNSASHLAGQVTHHFMHSSRASLAEVVALAAAAVGAPPDGVVVHASPYGDKWYPMAQDDTGDYHNYTRCHHQYLGRTSVVMVEARTAGPFAGFDVNVSAVASPSSAL
ncbi:hypothetical protein pdul_cds_791 [Pandoravirus dulcis]|uniref:BTB/POZ domain containing protein n=1 Tax=Pandoravirus dulcis TaxID=1349409 RepID=S4VRL1_9VIRU|nr:hypothetical protein pdul_cds_791 [Pandoravirus dulcis]AGO82988.2 hypothetical protein pdul_cds_791 [Pandoravirus dulcis]